MFLKFPEEVQKKMVQPSFYTTQIAFLHEAFVEQLCAESRKANRNDLQNEFRVMHHIVPQFEGGTDASENCVFLHQYQHGLVHLFCFLWKKNSTDLNAFSSACLTQNQVEKRADFFNPKRELAREKTVRNLEWQETFGRKGVENSVKKRKEFLPYYSDTHRQNLAVAAKKTQPRAIAARISLWVRFLCQSKLTFQNVKTGEQVSFEQVGISENRTVVEIARALKQQFPECAIPPTNGFKFAELFRLEKSQKWDWTFVSLTVEHSLQYFEIPFSTFCRKGQGLHKLFLLLVYFIYRENNLSEKQKNSLQKKAVLFFSKETGLPKAAVLCVYTKMFLFLEDFYKTFPTEKASNPEVETIFKNSFSPCIFVGDL